MSVWGIAIITVLGLLLFSLIFVFIMCEIVYRLTLKKNSIASRIINRYVYKNLKKYNMDFSWWGKIPHEELCIKSHDKLNLYARYIKNKTNNLAIVVHGYGANSLEMQQYAKMFYEFGFSVLAPDNRAHGNSDGKVITMGFEDRKDVLTWIKYMLKQNSNFNIVVFGLSMGAATTCMLSGMKTPDNVKCFISDCAYSSAFDVFEGISEMSVFMHILPIMRIFNYYSKLRAGFFVRDVVPANEVKKCTKPILLIHGDKDFFVPFYMQDRIYSNIDEKLRRKLVIKGAEHAQSIAMDKKMYFEAVNSFLTSNGFKVKQG